MSPRLELMHVPRRLGPLRGNTDAHASFFVYPYYARVFKGDQDGGEMLFATVSCYLQQFATKVSLTGRYFDKQLSQDLKTLF